jgi:hypothetical protein
MEVKKVTSILSLSRKKYHQLLLEVLKRERITYSFRHPYVKRDGFTGG